MLNWGIAVQNEQQKSVAAQLVLQQGAIITQLNGKDYFRIEKKTSKFIYCKTLKYYFLFNRYIKWVTDKICVNRK